MLGGLLARADRVLRLLEDGLLVILLAGLVLLATAQILLRNVFSIGLAWADGSVRLAVLWLALLGAIAAAREGRHIAIDVVARSLPPPLRRVVATMTAFFTAMVCGLLAWHSWRFVQDSRAFGDVLLDQQPAWLFQLIMPLGFALIALRYLLRAVGLEQDGEGSHPRAGAGGAGAGRGADPGRADPGGADPGGADPGAGRGGD